MRKKAILLFLVSLVMFSCGDSEFMPEAALIIEMQYDPVIFSYDGALNSWCCSNCVIITEINKVGGYIASVELKFLSGSQAYETKNYSGKHFKASESWSVCDTICITNEYVGIIVELEGEDENDHPIISAKYFPIHYQ